jgi:hypothetical protein
MSKYNNSKIYKIIDNTNGNVYIGSTFQKYITTRLASHVSNYKRYLNNNCRFVTSFEIIKNGNYDIVLIENVNCETKEQLHARERYYIEAMSCINKNIPNRSPKEWKKENYIQNKDEIIQKNKEYYTQNKDKISEKNKIKYNKNKDEILEKRKEYRNTHKDEISEYLKEYYIQNKDEISERIKIKFICVCGSECRISDKARHERSIKHQTYLENQAILVDVTSIPETR